MLEIIRKLKAYQKTEAFDLVNNVLFLGIGCCISVGNYDADKNCGPNSIGATKAFLTLFCLGAAGIMVYQYYMYGNVMKNFNKTHDFSPIHLQQLLIIYQS